MKKKKLNFSDLELIFKDLKSLFEKRGFIINWKALEKQSLNETINALSMASPFSLEEKQILLEAKNLDIRKNKIAEILKLIFLMITKILHYSRGPIKIEDLCLQSL